MIIAFTTCDLGNRSNNIIVTCSSAVCCLCVFEVYSTTKLCVFFCAVVIVLFNRHRQVNHARNVWDRAVTILPRANQFWYKYTYMEEMLGNVAGLS